MFGECLECTRSYTRGVRELHIFIDGKFTIEKYKSILDKNNFHICILFILNENFSNNIYGYNIHIIFL